MKVEGGGHYLRAVNDGACTVLTITYCCLQARVHGFLKILLKSEQKDQNGVSIQVQSFSIAPMVYLALLATII